jgi:phospholipase/carboxylesterase
MKLAEHRRDLGGLSAITIGDPGAPTVVVVLHGRMMSATDLSPFAHALGVPAYFVFPDAPLPAVPQGRTWWPVDAEARAQRRVDGAADLHALDPPGRAVARERLASLCAEVSSGKRLVLVGFSQGGMLAMDHVLHGGRVDALVLLSSTRIAFSDWQPRLPRLAGLPMLIAHGHADGELAFAAGEGLRDAAVRGGADVQWLPFDGGHEIPLVVWRGLRHFLRRL